MTDSMLGMNRTVTTNKGMVAYAEAVFSPTTEWGIRTEWAVALHFQSPTGDSSDFMVRELPCLSKEQAENIAEAWNAKMRGKEGI